MRLLIWPEPSADEAAAINAALTELVARTVATGRRLRYGDVVRTRDAATRDMGQEATARPLGRLTWKDAARLESLDSGV